MQKEVSRLIIKQSRKKIVSKNNGHLFDLLELTLSRIK